MPPIVALRPSRQVAIFSGRLGALAKGPEIFGNTTDIKLAPDRSIWINDPANSRITVITSTGHFLRSLRTLAPLHRIIPLRDSSYLAFSAGAVFLVRYSPNGSRIGSLPEPQFLAGVNPRAAESLFLPLPDGGSNCRLSLDDPLGPLEGRWGDLLANCWAHGPPIPELRLSKSETRQDTARSRPRFAGRAAIHDGVGGNPPNGTCARLRALSLRQRDC